MSLASKSTVTLRYATAVAAAAGAGGAGAGAGAQQANPWNGHPWWLIWSCIAVPDVVAVGEQIRLIRVEKKRVPLAERRAAIDRAPNDAVLRISDLTQDTGCRLPD